MSQNDELSVIVGAENVLDSPGDWAEYATQEEGVIQFAPRCVVRPKDATEIQKIVTWANASHAPLVPLSSGPPHLRGDSHPSSEGAVVVDLRRMNRVVRVDPEHRIALVEPGVTFRELVPAVRKSGLRLNLPLLPRPTKSVLASALEREPVIMPKYHWDISDPLACTEIVYGSGEFFKTGSAAGPGSLDEQWDAGAAQNEAAGPIQADFVRLIQGAQGTMGVVTWATVRCEHLPSIEEPYLVGSENLDRLLQFAHWLIRNRWADDCLLLNDVDLARIMGESRGRQHEESRSGLPGWVLFYSISGVRYFPEERIHHVQTDISHLAASLALEPLRSVGEVSAFDLMNLLHDPPAAGHWKSGHGLGCKDIFFISISDDLQRLVSAMMATAGEFGYPTSDVGVYLQPLVQAVNYHCEFNLFFDRDDRAEKARVDELFEAASRRLSDLGGFFSRPYGSWADMAYGKDPATVAALRKVKTIFDPNNVMNPGKLCF
jgi:FAD/FMN-containing dehydrogenase